MDERTACTPESLIPNGFNPRVVLPCGLVAKSDSYRLVGVRSHGLRRGIAALAMWKFFAMPLNT